MEKSQGMETVALKFDHRDCKIRTLVLEEVHCVRVYTNLAEKSHDLYQNILEEIKLEKSFQRASKST